ncbi:hypothetical protein ACIBCT_11025 [Streptosporangium sp. NPDC050855]|uniref:hypothetical protein n=1 Tax=Streptosporangium sp. NPDC050855 TaxID=3366194 RepID=UPI0037B5E493
MSLLEDRYRRVLRLLPASYRAEREEEMVCAFLEGAAGLTDANDPRPRWSEVASVAALSLRVRLGGAGAAPRFLAWGRAVRLAAVLGLLFHATMSCAWFLEAVRGSLSTGRPAVPGEVWSEQWLSGTAQILGYLLWIAVFGTLVRGHPRTAKILALLALVSFYGPLAQGGHGTGNAVVYGLLFAVPVLALVTGFHRDAPPPRHPRWTAALPVLAGVPLHVLLSVLGSPGMSRTVDWHLWSWLWPWLSTSGTACLAFLVASAICLGRRPRAPGGRDPALPLALAVLSVSVVLARVAFLTVDAVDPATRVMAAVNIGQLVAVLLCGLTLTRVAVRALPAPPRVPDVPPSSPSG